MSGYENAPATILLATKCAFCARPLVDSRSVELGAGPDCRVKYGVEELEGVNASEANRLVHRIALWQTFRLARAERRRLDGYPTVEDAAEALNALRGLGFATLAGVFESKVCRVVIKNEEEGARFSVRAPYSPHLVWCWKSMGGRFFKNPDAEKSTWHFDAKHRAAVYRELCHGLEECLGSGPRGVFPIGIHVWHKRKSVREAAHAPG